MWPPPPVPPAIALSTTASSPRGASSAAVSTPAARGAFSRLTAIPVLGRPHRRRREAPTPVSAAPLPVIAHAHSCRFPVLPRHHLSVILCASWSCGRCWGGRAPVRFLRIRTFGSWLPAWAGWIQSASALPASRICDSFLLADDPENTGKRTWLTSNSIRRRCCRICN